MATEIIRNTYFRNLGISLLLFYGGDVEVLENERIYVGILVDNLCNRLAAAVAGLTVDTDEFGGYL